jgi:hypothetical protein
MKTPVIAVAIIFAAVIVYAATAKTITTSTGGGHTENHGGVLNFLSGWFNNVSVSGIGAPGTN